MLYPVKHQLGFKMSPFWEGFGCQDGAKILKKSILDLSKNYIKKYVVLEAQKIDFGPILASKTPPQEGPQKLGFGVFFGPGRVLGPRWPQDLPKASQDRFFLILDPNLVDFGPQLGGFGANLSMLSLFTQAISDSTSEPINPGTVAGLARRAIGYIYIYIYMNCC